MSLLDVVFLREFYASPLGQLARRTIDADIKRRWESVVGLSIAGLGYATPYLSAFRPDAMRTLALMPAEQGVLHWPSPGEPNSTALIEEEALPLPSASIDRVLIVHLLEVTDHPAEMLREAWRVLEGGGRLILVVPARRGWWAGAEWTPFGHGRPYSRSQLTDLLRETLFTPLDWSEALLMPPSNRASLVRSGPFFERAGRFLKAPFAGVHIVEATKQVYSAVPSRRASKLAAQLNPVLVPVVEPGRANRNETG